MANKLDPGTRRLFLCRNCGCRRECQHVLDEKNKISGWQCKKCGKFVAFDREDDQ